MNCNTCKMCESADKRLESFVASKAGEFETSLEEGENDEGKSRTTDLQDEPKGVPGVSGSSKRAGTDGRVRSEKE